jgi:hypothetical protein
MWEIRWLGEAEGAFVVAPVRLGLVVGMSSELHYNSIMKMIDLAPHDLHYSIILKTAWCSLPHMHPSRFAPLLLGCFVETVGDCCLPTAVRLVQSKEVEQSAGCRVKLVVINVIQDVIGCCTNKQRVPLFLVNQRKVLDRPTRLWKLISLAHSFLASLSRAHNFFSGDAVTLHHGSFRKEKEWIPRRAWVSRKHPL